MRTRGLRKGWVVFLTVVLGIVSLICLGAYLRERRMAPFRPFLNSYLAVPDEKLGAAYFRSGKMILVDVVEHDFDGLFFQLPRTIAAETPEEVGTIAQLKWGKKQHGEYSGIHDPGSGGAAYVRTCVVTLVDRKSMKVIEMKRFVGSEPPEIIHAAESTMGTRPDDAVINYLKSFY